MRNHLAARHVRQAVLALVIVACDASTSPFSPPENALDAKAASSGAYHLTATAPSWSEVTLAWTDESSNETGYEVQRSTTGPAGAFGLLAQVGANATSYSDGGVAATTSYCYRVAAYRLVGRSLKYSAFSSVACATTRLAPPSNAHAAALSSTEAKITWTAGAGTATGFRVERAGSTSGPWTAAATTSGTITAFTDAGRAPDQQLCYRVIGFTTSDETAPSNAACTTLLAAPTNLVASTAPEGIDLTWRDNSALEGYYVVEQSVDGVGFYVLATAPANSTSYHQSGVSSSTRYWYRVRAQRGDDRSDYSNTASATGGCVSTGVEVCDNGVDDDCDGDVDGADADCGELVDCNANPCGSGTICNGQYCVSSCHDGYKDSDESDVDCGGGCGFCQLSQRCWGNYDCASDNCVYHPGDFQGVCQAPVTKP